MSRPFRSSASFGKRQEFVAIAALLQRGYDVYLTLVDDQGIDCVVRQGPDRYFDIQVKARSKDANPKNAGFFPQLPIENPRPNYIFIFYCEGVMGGGLHWVIPSLKLAEEGFGNSLKSGPRKGQYRIRLTNYSPKRKAVIPRPKFRGYIDAFEKFLGPPPA